MKFVNKTTGELFDTIEDAHKSYCQNRQCDCTNCPVSICNNPKITYCTTYCKDFPETAAKMMGFDVVKEKKD